MIEFQQKPAVLWYFSWVEIYQGLDLFEHVDSLLETEMSFDLIVQGKVPVDPLRMCVICKSFEINCFTQSSPLRYDVVDVAR